MVSPRAAEFHHSIWRFVGPTNDAHVLLVCLSGRCPFRDFRCLEAPQFGSPAAVSSHRHVPPSIRFWRGPRPQANWRLRAVAGSPVNAVSFRPGSPTRHDRFEFKLTQPITWYLWLMIFLRARHNTRKSYLNINNVGLLIRLALGGRWGSSRWGEPKIRREEIGGRASLIIQMILETHRLPPPIRRTDARGNPRFS